MKRSKDMRLTLLQNIPAMLFVIVFVVFGFSTRNWFTWTNFSNILTQSSYIGILAIGITLPLLTAGTDLSVGANMYLSASVAAIMIRGGANVALSLGVCLLVGLVFGCVNAFFVVKVRVPAFAVTIGTMTAGRGIALRLTNSEQIAMPPELVSGIGSGKLFGVLPYPVIIFAAVVAIVTIFLKNTSMGRQIFAVGFDREAAQKAGIKVERVWAWTYILCGFFAALSAIVSVAQIGNVIPAFGEGYEFNAISASVLGGTSLAGGIANIFPGVVIGTVLIQMVEAGLVFLQVDLYIQPLISAMVILLAVFLDSVRTRYIRRLQTRNIRTEE
jgi:ribose/xylose/arabinose/galactoside ABC-type transport system permease subunit